MIKKCIICEQNFITNYHRVSCCSIICKNTYKKECYKKYNKLYYTNNKNKIKNDNKEYRQQHKEYYENYIKKYILEHKEYFEDYYRYKRKTYRKEYYQKIEVKKHRKEYYQTINGKEVIKRARHKRQRSLGFNPLNNYFNNSHAHHINVIDIIYIPISYHFSGHSVIRNRNMEPINTVAFFFLVMQNIDKIRKII